MKIIFPTENGICVLHPTGELPIEQVALKDVPDGVPFRIIQSNDIPEDRTFRDAWEADFTAPDGYGIGHEKWFSMQESKND